MFDSSRSSVQAIAFVAYLVIHIITITQVTTSFKVTPSIRRGRGNHWSVLYSVVRKKWQERDENLFGNGSDDDEQLLENVNDKSWLQLFPRAKQTVPEVERACPDFAKLKPDDPLWLDMAWPTEAGPEASAYARHLQWKRRLSDGERLRWQKWAIYQRLLKKDTFHYSVEDYVFQNMLRSFTEQAMKKTTVNSNKLQHNNDNNNAQIIAASSDEDSMMNVEAGLWQSIPISYKHEEEVEIRAVLKAYYSALNRRNYDAVRTLWLPDNNVELVLPGFAKARGYLDVDRLFKKMVKESKPFGSIDTNIVQVSVLGYVAVAQTIETVNVGTELKIAQRKRDEKESKKAPPVKQVVTTHVLRKFNKQWRVMIHHAARFTSSPYTGGTPVDKLISKIEKKSNARSSSKSVATSNVAKTRGLPAVLPDELQNLLKDHGSALSSVSRMKKDGSWEKVVLVDNETSPKDSQKQPAVGGLIENLLGAFTSSSESANANGKSSSKKGSKNGGKDDSSSTYKLFTSSGGTATAKFITRQQRRDLIDKNASLSKQTLQALRLLFDIGKLSRKSKDILVYDLISCIAKDSTSLAEVAFELLTRQYLSDSGTTKIASNGEIVAESPDDASLSDQSDFLDEFSDYCKDLVREVELQNSRKESDDDDDDYEEDDDEDDD